MSEEFKAITSQEQLDAIISERLKRERDTVAKQYSDYEQLKKSNKSYENELKALREENKRVSELESKVQKYETDSVKTRIAHEYGIPVELATRLNGSNEEEFRKDAELLADLVKKEKAPAPLASTEDKDYGKASTDLAFRELVRNL